MADRCKKVTEKCLQGKMLGKDVTTMNKVILMGRRTKNPEIKYAGKDNNMAVARYTLAVNRRYKRDGEQEVDFISCVTFGKNAEFAQKYLYKGMRIVIGGRISTGSYKDKDGKTIYTTDVIVEEHEFAQKGCFIRYSRNSYCYRINSWRKKMYSMKNAYKEKGEKILNGLQQGIANESTESIDNYDSIREVDEEGNI